MKFIEKIIENSPIKEAKLYKPAKKASISPETGITIQTPAAFHVIRDSATIATRYLPHFVFGHYANPFEALKNKFTRLEIQEFVTDAKQTVWNHQLLCLILDKIKKSGITTHDQLNVSSSVLEQSVNNDDPYGDYEYSSAVTTTPIQHDEVEILCNAFNAQ